MQDRDKEKFAILMTGLSEIYNYDLSVAAIEIWFQSLKHYDIEAISRAISVYISSPDASGFMPKPGQIIKLIAGTSRDSSYIAWTKVDNAVRRIGNYQTVVFDDPIIHRVISDMGGWCMLCSKEDEEWPYVANEFQARYTGYKNRQEMPEYPKKLLGEVEIKNKLNGFQNDIPEPVLIGDEGKAALVLENKTKLITSDKLI